MCEVRISHREHWPYVFTVDFILILVEPVDIFNITFMIDKSKYFHRCRFSIRFSKLYDIKLSNVLEHSSMENKICNMTLLLEVCSVNHFLLGPWWQNLASNNNMAIISSSNRKIGHINNAFLWGTRRGNPWLSANAISPLMTKSMNFFQIMLYWYWGRKSCETQNK